MKTLNDLFGMIALAVESNKAHNHWFIDFSGHVNKLSIRHYVCGWSSDTEPNRVEFYLDENGIQGAYWFIKSNLK